MLSLQFGLVESWVESWGALRELSLEGLMVFVAHGVGGGAG